MSVIKAMYEDARTILRENGKESNACKKEIVARIVGKWKRSMEMKGLKMDAVEDKSHDVSGEQRLG